MDASALIYIGALGLYGELQFLGPLVVAPAVWMEVVVAGTRRGAADVARTIAAEAAGLLTRRELSTMEAGMAAMIGQQFGIGPGESQVLATANMGGTAILDDRQALRAALDLRISAVSTLQLPIVGLGLGALDKDAATTLLNQLSIVSKPTATSLIRLQAQIEEG